MASAAASWPGTFARGNYGDVHLDGLNVVALAAFEGNV
jgi:hypothetical protein